MSDSRDGTPTGDLGAGDDGSSEDFLGEGSASVSLERIGPYRILTRLGEGGMGIVYLAEQTEPIQRRVAIKVLKPGMDSTAILKRFNSERQVLERMDHRNIAGILDAGMTEKQRPYFVMEYVRGLPITEHADRERLGIEERLELFIQVCEAVQHAHHKGVIHRDLKPNNILVEWDETKPVPKVIDFGVARLTDQSGNDAAFTHHGQIIGTPEYMSPEQAEMTAQDIDTRTDVYSLGVVLYELLIGLLPFASETLRQVGVEAIRSIIRDSDPPIPSRRLRTLEPSGDTTIDTVVRTRGTDSKRLLRLLRNDLDWVVMRCLEKRRDRRYGTPSELAIDLRRFLSGETVLTGPPRVSYRVGKFVRRHRSAVSAAGLVLASLLVGLGVAVWQWQRAEANASATRQLATELISAFHDEVAELPGARRARSTLLDLGIAHLDEASRNARGDTTLLLTLAEAYEKLGDTAGGLRMPHTGDLDQADELYRRAFALRERALTNAPSDPHAVVALAGNHLKLGNLAWERLDYGSARTAYEDGLGVLDDLSQQEAESRDAALVAAQLHIDLANTLATIAAEPAAGTGEQERLLRVADRLTNALVTAEYDEQTSAARARALSQLGDFLRRSGRADEALPLLDQSVRIRQQLFDVDPVKSTRRRDLAAAQFYLGHARAVAGESDAALALLNDALEHFRFLAAADPDDVEARSRLSQVHETLGTYAQTTENKIRHFRQAVRLSEQSAAETGNDIGIERLGKQRFNLAKTLALASLFQDAEAESAKGFKYRLTLLGREPDEPRSHELLLKHGEIRAYAADQVANPPAQSEGEPADNNKAAERHLAIVRDDLEAAAERLEGLGSGAEVSEERLAVIRELRQFAQAVADRLNELRTVAAAEDD